MRCPRWRSSRRHAHGAVLVLLVCARCCGGQFGGGLVVYHECREVEALEIGRRQADAGIALLQPLDVYGAHHQTADMCV